MDPDPELAEASGTPQVKHTLLFCGQNSGVIASALLASEKRASCVSKKRQGILDVLDVTKEDLHSAASSELVDHFITMIFF